MASNHTTNYNLNQWEATDKVLRTDFNADNAKIDAALAGLAGTVAEHTASLAAKGNLTVQMLSYTGNGGYGESSPTVINFPKRPVFFLAFGHQGVLIAGGDDTSQAQVIRYNGLGTGVMTSNFTWNGNQARFWWQEAYGQLNVSGKPYRVIAFYLTDET